MARRLSVHSEGTPLSVPQRLMDEPLSSACLGKAVEQSRKHWSGTGASPFYSEHLSAALLDASPTTRIRHPARLLTFSYSFNGFLW